jgi:hypothetical protein
MPITGNKIVDPYYQIKIQGNLSQEWSRSFTGMAISSEIDNHGTQITSLTGMIADQAKLRGIMNKIWDLNLIVLSLNRLDR